MLPAKPLKATVVKSMKFHRFYIRRSCRSGPLASILDRVSNTGQRGEADFLPVGTIRTRWEIN